MTFGAWIPWDLDIAHAWDRAEAKREQRSRRKTNALYRRLARQRVRAILRRLVARMSLASNPE